MTDKDSSDLWWKNTVFYCLDVETFFDANGDGIGDFEGLTRRVDYLASLGVGCIWLMPFYPTPNRDDGYDITDFYGIDPRLGTLGDFVVFTRTATERGIRVIVDLVVNHTSWQHPWFQSARSDPDSPYRDWYVWTDEKPEDVQAKVIFPDAEDSLWTWDDEAGQYYLHRFYAEQPDLNIGHPEVREEIHKIMGFWLQLGVSGFRVDAVPYLIERLGIEEQTHDDPHVYLKEATRFMSRRRGDAAMVGEVNLAHDQQMAFFGGEEANELHLLFNFVGCGKLFLCLARETATPLAEELATLPVPPPDRQWANFVRNHDELNLSRLPDGEMHEVLDAFAPDDGMRMYGRGIRRRLPPMLQGDPRRVRLAYSLMLTLPGSPTLFYGEEIGMGENLEVPGRLAVRTPMQWSDAPNAGFSTAGWSDLRRPVPTGGPWSYEKVNVARQRRDPESLLSWMQQALRSRRECPELGWGDWTVLQTGDEQVLAVRFDWHGGRVIAVHNLGAQDRTVALDLSGDWQVESVEDVVADDDYAEATDKEVTLAGYGYRWLRVRPEGTGGAW